MALGLRKFRTASLMLVVWLSFPAANTDAGQSRGVKIVPAAQPLTLSLQLGHRKAIRQFAYTPDGTVFVSLSPSAGLKLWDGTNGRLLRTLDVDEDQLLAMSPDGEHIATANDKGIRLWELSSGRMLRKMAVQNGVQAIGFSPDGSRLASTDSDGTLLLSDVGSGERVGTITVAVKTGANDVNLSQLAFSRDSRQIVVVVNRTVQNSLALVDVATAQVVRKINVGFDQVDSLSLSPDGRRVAVATGTRGAMLYDLADGKKCSVVGRDVSPKSVVFSADGSTLVLVGSGGTPTSLFDPTVYGLVEVWDGEGTALTRSFRLPSRSGSAAVFSPDNGSILFDDGGRIRVLDVQKATTRALATGEVSATVKLAFSPDGSKLALGSFGRVQLLDFDQPVRSRTIKVASNWVTALAFQPDGEGLSVAAGNETGTWSLTTKSAGQTANHTGFAETRSAQILTTSPKLITAAFGGGARLMAITSDAALVQLWDLQTAEMRRELSAPGTSMIGTPALSGDGRVAAAIVTDFTKSFLVLWDTGDGRQLAKIAAGCSNLALNSDGTLVACSQESEVSLLDSREGRVIHSLKGAGPVKFSADDARLFTAASARRADGGRAGVRQWDTRSGALLREVNLPSGIDMHDFTVSPTGKVVAAAGSDSMTRIFSGDSGRELMTVALIDDGWVVMTPEGYYDASSKEAEKALLVRHGEGLFEVLPVASYREKFYRPDVVRETLAGNVPSVLLRAAEQTGKPPRVRLGSVPAQVFEGRLELPLSVQDQGGGIGDLRVYVNGTTVVAEAGGALSAAQTEGQSRVISLRLAAGRNEISVIAFNAANSVSSEPVQALVEASSPMQKKPQLHVLIVGIDQFQNPALNLRYAVNDARAVADLFRKQTAGRLFEKVNVQLLTEPGQTTRAAILKAFAGYRDIAPEDVFVFYVASHGTVEGDDLSSKEYFLITSNVGSSSIRALRRDAISQQEMKNLIGNIPAGKKTLLLDTCHSGALGLALQSGTRGLAEDSAVKVLSNAIGSTVISASTSQQQSLEGYENHGVFSWVLLQALGGKADIRGRGYVTTLDLAGYVEDEVPKIAEKVFHAKQFPNLHTSGQAFPLVLSR